ncbi:MAG: SCO6745 family protein [Pseudonocardiaceae bacterium]
MNDGTARRMWQLYEPIHDVTYFTPEARAAADSLGVRGFWMGYFALRVAPLGPVGPAVAAAAFFGFHPDRVARALPDAWTYANPHDAIRARLAGADAALRRLWGDVTVESQKVADAADLAWQAASAADTAGRILAAANQALPRPAQPHLALWQAATTLREHRGDGHIAVLLARGVSPVQAHLIKAAAGEADPAVLRESRRWSADAWRSAVEELSATGWLDVVAHLTPAGAAQHDEIEAATDRAAMQPWRALGEPATARLAELVTPLAAAVVGSGILPTSNPVGLTAHRQSPHPGRG